MSTKKTAPKKRTKTPTQLDRIERKLDLLLSSKQEVKEAEQPKEADPEKRVPKAGDWVVCDRNHEGDEDGVVWVEVMDALVGVPMKVERISRIGHPIASEWYWHPSWLRPATPSEVEAHQQKEKLSKLKFGTPVKTPDGEGLYWHEHGADHRVAFPDGTSFFYGINKLTIL